jgi:CCR4-NOT transcription complex subunit 3
MERFKAIEKEMKTKQYSTIGLISHSKLDPKEQQRLDLVQWIQGKVEELQQQVEGTEAELETLRAGAKKRGKGADAGQARVEQLDLQNERRNWHVSQLEVILRLVENSSLKLEDVENVKEDVDFFVANNGVFTLLSSLSGILTVLTMIRKRISSMMTVYMPSLI